MSVLIPVVMSGGAGTRLWPVSREGHPKPFMKLADGETLIEKTYRRAAKLPGFAQLNGKAQLVTVTNRDYYFMSRDELNKVGITGDFLLEPCGRNTAPAVAMAAHFIQKQFGADALMLVLSADHLIQDEDAFAQAVENATVLISKEKNALVTFGIIPTAPEIGFGYIKAGDEVEGGNWVEAFVEKPDAATAQKYLSDGNYFWNSGMFCFKASTFLAQLREHCPDVSNACALCWNDLENQTSFGGDMLEMSEALFEKIPDISIDYALMERSKEVAVIPSDIGWSDIGSWRAVQDLFKPDSQNNRSCGEAIFVNSKNTFIQSEDRMVAAVGLDNIIIIDTPDALLVANPENSQDVKQVVGLLKKADHDAFKLHKTVFRPWGTYTILEDSPGYKMKRIEVKPGGQLSLQMHHHRSEHWIVVTGQAVVINGENELVIRSNESTYIPAGHKHRLENRTQDPLVLIEVQCGSYLGEDDIIRFEDTYGRV